jgi:transcriptional regulator with XRE-family HTH domain
MPASPLALRVKLGLERAEMAHALNVDDRTWARWESGEAEPSGVAAAVLLGLDNALRSGADAGEVARLLRMGLAAMLCIRLTER